MDTVNQLANELKLKVLSHLNYKPKLKTGTFNQLSNELKLLVFSHLDFVSKLECVFVCKSWGELIFSNCLFEDICINPKTLQFFKTQMEYSCQVKYLTFFGFTDDSYPILLELPDIFPNVRSFKVRLGEQFDLGLPKIRKTRRVSYYDIDFLFADDQEDDDQEDDDQEDDDQEDDYQEVRYREVEYEGIDEEAIIKKYQEQFTKWKQLDTIYEDQYRDTPLISCVLLQQPTNYLVSITLCGGETYYDYWDNYCLESSEFITKLKKMLSTDLKFATSLQHLRIMGNVVTLQMLEDIHKAVPHLKRLELHDFIPDIDDLDVESPYERPGEICDTLELFDCKVYFKEYYRENRLADELINPVWLSYIADKNSVVIWKSAWEVNLIGIVAPICIGPMVKIFASQIRRSRNSSLCRGKHQS